MKNKMNGAPSHASHIFSSLSILLAGGMWGTMGLWVRKFSQEGLDSLQILSLRVTLTAFLLLLFLGVYNRTLLKIHWKDLWCFAGTGICSIVFFGYCYNQTILLTSLSVAAILLYTAPIFVMVLSRFLFGERFTVQKMAALLLAFAGCICVTGILSGDHAVSTTGILTGLGSGFGYALYSIFGRYALERNYHPFTVTFYTFLCAMACVLFLADWKPITDFAASSPSGLCYSIAYCLVTTVLPYILYTFGLDHVEAGKASIMATIEPVIATLLGIFVLQESISATGILGIVLVLCALVLLNK